MVVVSSKLQKERDGRDTVMKRVHKDKAMACSVPMITYPPSTLINQRCIVWQQSNNWECVCTESSDNVMGILLLCFSSGPRVSLICRNLAWRAVLIFIE